MTNDTTKLEYLNKPIFGDVDTRSLKRRRWTQAEKFRLIEECNETGSSVSLIARKYGLSASQLFLWRKQLSEGGMVSLVHDEPVVPQSEVRALEARVKELERILGRKTLEAEVLREALDLAVKKKKAQGLILQSPLLQNQSLPVNLPSSRGLK